MAETTSVPPFEGVPIGCPTEQALRDAFRAMQWLANNYESEDDPEWVGLLEGARCIVSCAYEIYGVHLDAEFGADRRRRTS